MNQSPQDLQKWLDELDLEEDGRVPLDYIGEIQQRLAAIWDTLKGSQQAAMNGRKLVGRAEDITWQPPILCFTMERHGGTVMGSSRATLQEWRVDLGRETVTIERENRYRQLHDRQRPVKVQSIVERLLEAIRNERRDEPGLKWKENSVRVVAVELFPSATQRTMEERRKRLWAVLIDQAPMLEAIGWHYNAETHTFVREISLHEGGVEEEGL
ncbi:MAG: hypothetical protein OWU33_15105 [Firmicutes bacterium]|nr:hypothetical protein [Bacillota bacterium]